MIVIKFGGSCLTQKKHIDSIATILSKQNALPILVVVSAMGKTTRHLEEVVVAYYDARDTEQANVLLTHIEKQHFNCIKELLPSNTYAECLTLIQECLNEIRLTLEEHIEQTRSYYYDQIVCVGELLSSMLLHFILQKKYGMAIKYIDARDVLVTDNHFGQAHILWDKTRHRISTILQPLLTQSIVITQGFIGTTEENQSTTLGKEGSDYSAAIFSHLLSAQHCHIYKDVAGIMNADPQLQASTQTLPFLSYEQMAELAYFGARVIHPKTLYPLKKSAIPLSVRAISPNDLPYTQVFHNAELPSIPTFTRKDKQVLLSLKNKEEHFMADVLFHLSSLTEYSLPPCTFVHLEATTLILCFSVEEIPHHLEAIIEQWSLHFDINRKDEITLLSWWHTSDEDIKDILGNTSPIFYLKTNALIRVLVATSTLPQYTHQRKT